MSEVIVAEIWYNLPLDPSNVELVFSALADAVAENWGRFRDDWATAEPEYKADVGRWTAECGDLRPNSLGARAGSIRRLSNFGFSFSPLSSRCAGTGVIVMPDGSMKVFLEVSSNCPLEIQGERETDRMMSHWEAIRKARGEKPPIPIGPYEDDPSYDDWWETYNRLGDTHSVWPQNLACLQHIIGRLRSVLPVRRVEIDKPLQGGEAGFPVDSQEV